MALRRKAGLGSGVFTAYSARLPDQIDLPHDSAYFSSPRCTRPDRTRKPCGAERAGFPASACTHSDAERECSGSHRCRGRSGPCTAARNTDRNADPDCNGCADSGAYNHTVPNFRGGAVPESGCSHRACPRAGIGSGNRSDPRFGTGPIAGAGRTSITAVRRWRSTYCDSAAD